MKQELLNARNEGHQVYEKPEVEIIEMEMEDGVLLVASVGRNGQGSGLGNGRGGEY